MVGVHGVSLELLVKRDGGKLPSFLASGSLEVISSLVTYCTMECGLAGIVFCRILSLIGLGLGYLSFPQDVLPASLTHPCCCAIRRLWLQLFVIFAANRSTNDGVIKIFLTKDLVAVFFKVLIGWKFLQEDGNTSVAGLLVEDVRFFGQKALW